MQNQCLNINILMSLNNVARKYICWYRAAASGDAGGVWLRWHGYLAKLLKAKAYQRRGGVSKRISAGGATKSENSWRYHGGEMAVKRISRSNGGNGVKQSAAAAGGVAAKKAENSWRNGYQWL